MIRNAFHSVSHDTCRIHPNHIDVNIDTAICDKNMSIRPMIKDAYCRSRRRKILDAAGGAHSNAANANEKGENGSHTCKKARNARLNGQFQDTVTFPECKG